MSGPHSDQDHLWDHFQNEGVESFAQNDGRIEYLARQLRRSERVLNIGVGNGALESRAKAAGVDIWCLDPGERAITNIRNTLGLGDKAQTGYCQALPFDDNVFDAVVMSEVLEHLTDDVLQQTLKEVHRVLKPEGRFLGTVPARERLADSLCICPCCDAQFHRWGHHQSFDTARLGALLSSEFSVQTNRETFFTPWSGVSLRTKLAGLIKRFLSWRGVGTYGICRNIYFVARKAR